MRRVPLHLPVAPRLCDYGAMIARGWLIVVLAAGLAALVPTAVAQFRDPGYVASARLFTLVPGDAGVRAAYEGARGAAAQTLSYPALAESSVVMQRVVDELGLPISAADLSAATAVTAMPESALVTVQVAGPDPAQAVTVVNALVATVAAFSQEVQWTDGGPAVEMVVLDAAAQAERPPGSLTRDTMLAGGIGLVVGVLGVLGLGIARDRVADRRQLADIVRRSTAGGPGNVL